MTRFVKACLLGLGLLGMMLITVAAYSDLVEKKTDLAQGDGLLQIVRHLLDEGHWQEGERALYSLDPTVFQATEEQNLLLAKIALFKEQPKKALAFLAKVQRKNIQKDDMLRYHELLAEAYHAEGNKQASIGERIKLDELLHEKSLREQNHRLLWLGLSELSDAELQTALSKENNRVHQGWLKLAWIARTDPSQKEPMLRIWQNDYPQHSAEALLLKKEQFFADIYPKPQHFALLLPLTGPLAGPAQAIKDGFLSAMREVGHDTKERVQFYNTDGKDVALLYNEAIQDGADYVIGPLSKSDVAVVAALEHPVPTVLLNDAALPPEEGAYQFGLSPREEAMQVALKAHERGYGRALVIAPSGDWGKDVSKAFRAQWQILGGHVVDTLFYAEHDDLNHLIPEFLKVNESMARAKRLKQMLGVYIETVASRRQDFDMIFLLAYPSKARQIMPMLNYYYLDDVPVYATSMSYAGISNPLRDKDLEGIIFCDIPWVFSHRVGEDNWPESLNSYNRLYALGKENYLLSTHLNQLLLFPAVGFKEDILYLNTAHRIGRVLAWAQFKHGMASRLMS